MANRINRGRQRMGALKLVGEIIKTMDIEALKQVVDKHDDECIELFKHRQSEVIHRVCPVYGLAYQFIVDRYWVNKGSD